MKNKNDENKIIKEWDDEGFKVAFCASPAPQAISHLPDGRWVDANDSYLKMLGYKKEEIVGHTSLELNMVLPEERKCIMEKAWSGDVVQNVELKVRTKTGEYIYVLYSVKKFEHRGETYICSTLIDITQRKYDEEISRYHSSLVGGMFDAAISTDLEHKIVSWNEAAEIMYGWKTEEVLGKNAAEFLQTDFKGDISLDDMLESLRKRTYWQGEVIQYRKDGTSIHVASSLKQLTDGNGKVIGVIAINRDITSRSLAEQAQRDSEAKYRMIVETTAEGIMISDPAGRITYVNQSLSNMLGYSTEEILGKTSLDFTFEDEIMDKRYKEGSKALAAHKTLKGEFLFRRKDGSVLWTLFHGTPKIDEHGKYIENLIMLSDITELKQAEEAKNKFIAILAHELRNPMASIMSSIELLDLYTQDVESILKDAPQVANFKAPLSVAERQLANMKRILDDLLDVSRLVHGKLMIKKKKVDLKAILSQVSETARPLFEKKEQSFTVILPRHPIYLMVDQIRIEQIVMNLLENASKYTQSKGTICLSLETESNEVVIRFKDNGIGISPDKLSKIFQPFFQAVRREKEAQGGLGIGLMLVQELVKLHGGSATVKSEGEGKGAEFILRFPQMNLLDK